MKNVFVDTLLPKETQRRRTVARLARRAGFLSPASPDIHYLEWTQRAEPLLWTKPKKLAHNPLISIVVPVFNSPPKYFMPMVYSLINQEFYQNWELVLVNASDKPKSTRLVEGCAQIDVRIKVINAENKGIAANTNLGIANCSGEYVGLLDHDDVLSPRALYETACLLQGKDKPQLIYSDEDKLTEDGEHRFDVHFKPDWSPQILRQVNYLNHFMVMKKSLLDKVGGYRPGYEGAQDYDLFLRLVDEKPLIAHIPKVLYHWRAAHGSTAQDFSTKKNVLEAGIKALDGHLKRNGQVGEVGFMIKQPGFYKTIYKPRATTRAAVLVIPSNDLKQDTYLVENIIESLSEASVPAEIFIGETLGKLKSKREKVSITKIKQTAKAEFIRAALGQTKADVLVIFNAAAVPKNKTWLDELAGMLVQVKSLGAIAPVLLDPSNDTIIDAGFVKLDSTVIGLFQGMFLKEHTYFGNTVWSRNVDYLSGRVLATKRDVFEKYFGDRMAGLDNLEPFNKMREDKLEVIIYPQVKMRYRGELVPPSHDTAMFNPNLRISRYEGGLEKGMNVPPGDTL